MGHVRMRPAMPGALLKRHVNVRLGIVDATGRVGADPFGKPIRVVRHIHPTRRLALVQDTLLILDLRPLPGDLRAVDIERFPILPCRIEERARHFRHHVRIAQREGRGLDRKAAAVVDGKFGIDASGAVTDDRSPPSLRVC